MNVLPEQKRLTIVSALVEGNSIRSTERMTGVHRDTIMRLLVQVGEHCGRLLNERVRRIQSRHVQVDEIWTYVFKKQAHLDSFDDHHEVKGDQYVFVALDADTKLAISHLVGKRDSTTAYYLMADLQSRIAHRVQLTTDGFPPYLNAVEDSFGADVDYAMLVKVYGGDRSAETQGPAWYGPAYCLSAVPTPITGDPDMRHISTSFIERQNLTMRMQMRRFTRLTNGFSKKLENLRAHVAMHFAWYNFARIHSTLRCTPAMEAGLTDHPWTLAELLNASSSRQPV
jgi:IS1 family transposase